ncbi:hypothetical protein HPB49_022241 [Dermacentor silvarum]|uniref:Uncharacterized protein n=1 Tax=Dermacentor silvarum TaxID=543639 RepID=A0ACB8E3I0_DERSI|nr:hypothetical protein HPB49_022241 [Dermacentor silvarum]
MLTKLFKGCSCFGAAAGACKTVTMQGCAEGSRIVYLMVRELHQRVDRHRSTGQTCKVDFVYINAVRGALCPAYGPPVFVRDIRLSALLSPTSPFTRQKGRRFAGPPPERHQKPGTVYVTHTGTVTGKRKSIRGPKMSFVDLPDLEHTAAVSRNIKDRTCDATKINLSFLALGNCIDALPNNAPLTNSEEESCPARRIPSRNSKLAHPL